MNLFDNDRQVKQNNGSKLFTGVRQEKCLR